MERLFVTLLQVDSSFLFLDGIEPFFGRRFSMWRSTKRRFSIFDLGPLTHKIYSPKFGTKSPISPLVCQIDRRCLHRSGGFQGWPIQWNHIKCCGSTLIATATTFALGAKSNRLPACLYLRLSRCSFKSLLLFCFSTESSHYLAVSSPWPLLQNVVLRFLI